MAELDRFDLEANAFLDIEENKEHLLKLAKEMVAQDPEIQPAGLIIDAAAPEASEVIKDLQKLTGKPFRGRGVVFPTQRETIVEMLRHNHPALLEYLEPPSTGRHRRLPIVVVAKQGAQLATFSFEVPESWEADEPEWGEEEEEEDAF